MKKIVLIILIHTGLFVSGQKSFFQNLNLNDTLTLKVQRIGCIALDPSNFYIIDVIKLESSYKLNYKFKSIEISKKIIPSEINLLIDFETNKKLKLYKICSAYNKVTITFKKKKKKFKTCNGADDVFLSKFGFK